MKQLFAVLMAALFAAASVNAVAQQTKGDGMEKKAAKSEKAKAMPKKAPAKKAPAKKVQKKGEEAKK